MRNAPAPLLLATAALAVFHSGCVVRGGDAAPPDAGVISLPLDAGDAAPPDAAPPDAALAGDLSSPSAPPDLAPTPALVTAYTGSAATAGQQQGAGPLNIGREFQVTQAGVVVRELGVWDQGQDGLASAHAVTLFSVDKAGAGGHATPLAGGSLVVPAGNLALLDNGFRFAPLPAPLALAPGNYAIIAYGFNAGDPYGDGGNVPASSTGVADLRFDPYQFVAAATPSFPSGGDGVAHTSASLRYQTKAPPFSRIMPLGDSITDGVGGTNAGYRLALGKLLANHGIGHQFVGSSSDNPGMLAADQLHHEGHSGWVIEAGSSGRAGLAGEIDRWLGPGGVDPDVVLLMIGTNDVDLDYDLAHAGARLDALITRMVSSPGGLRPHARLLVAQIVPIGDATEDARARTYNQTVASLVSAHRAKGEKLTLVDMHSALGSGDFSDKLHPNDAGYAKMAQAWLDAIMAP